MFTGIVQVMGRIQAREGFRLLLVSPLGEPKIGDSLAVEGVCLTVVVREPHADGHLLSFDVSEETLERSTLGTLKPGDTVNLEPPARVGDALGGHIVLGHVDGKGTLKGTIPLDGSALYEFSMPLRLRRYVVPKGSVAVDGISLTVVEAREDSFTVAIIPHTEKNTSLSRKKAGDPVNLEMDILAKHVEKLLEGWKASPHDDLFQRKMIP